MLYTLLYFITVQRVELNLMPSTHTPAKDLTACTDQNTPKEYDYPILCSVSEMLRRASDEFKVVKMLITKQNQVQSL